MRDYDPTTGRYIEADPLGLVDGASVYGYVRQNPGRYIDPRGEATVMLTHGGFIVHRDWQFVGIMPIQIGNVFYHRCSAGALVFHRRTKTDGPHWHYYPEGQTTGLGKHSPQWDGGVGDPHLRPPYRFTLPDCPCDGGEVNALAVLGAAAIVASMFTGAGEIAALGAGAVAVAQ